VSVYLALQLEPPAFPMRVGQGNQPRFPNCQSPIACGCGTKADNLVLPAT